MRSQLTNRVRHRARWKPRGLRRANLLLPDLMAPSVQARLEAACRKLETQSTAELDDLFFWSNAAWADTPAYGRPCR